jgi:hypothetical protein
MGFNRRKMEDERRPCRAGGSGQPTSDDTQVLEDAERLIVAWNARKEKRMPTIDAAVTARYWFLWVRCPACRGHRHD